MHRNQIPPPPPGSGSEAELRRRCFEEEALPHLRAVYNLALRLCHHEKNAEDLTQDTFLRAYRFFHRFETGTNLRAWLFRILKNLFLNRVQQRNPLANAEAPDRLDELQASPGWGWLSRAGRTPEEEAIASSTAAEVEQAIAALPPEYRIVVGLALEQELSYKEIAQILEIPLGTVMSRLHRGRRLLQHALSPSQETPSAAGREGSGKGEGRKNAAGGG